MHLYYIFLKQSENLLNFCPSDNQTNNPFAYNVEKWSNLLSLRFLKCSWQFFNIIYKKDKQLSSLDSYLTQVELILDTIFLCT